MPRFYQEMFNFACVTPAGTILNNWSDLIFSDFCVGKNFSIVYAILHVLVLVV